jgi:hypothetical protein
MRKQPPRVLDISAWQTKNESQKIHVRVPAALPLHEGNVSPVVRKKANVKQISRRSSVPVVQTKIDVLPGARRKSVNNTMQKVTMFSELRSYYDHITNEVKNEESYDPSMYTDQALLKRDALRFDEDIRKALSKIYIMTDQNRDAQIGKDEYIELSLRLQRLVIGKVEMHSALQIANMEWDFDRQGTDFLNFDRLILSFFQLADIWTDDISKESYLKFLDDVYNSIFTEKERAAGRLLLANGEQGDKARNTITVRALDSIAQWKPTRKPKHKKKTICRIRRYANVERMTSMRKNSESSLNKADASRLFLEEIMKQQNDKGEWQVTKETCALLGLKYNPALDAKTLTKLALKEIDRVGKAILERGRSHHNRRASFQWAQGVDKAKQFMDQIKGAERSRRRRAKNVAKPSIIADEDKQTLQQIGKGKAAGPTSSIKEEAPHSPQHSLTSQSHYTFAENQRIDARTLPTLRRTRKVFQKYAEKIDTFVALKLQYKAEHDMAHKKRNTKKSFYEVKMHKIFSKSKFRNRSLSKKKPSFHHEGLQGPLNFKNLSPKTGVGSASSFFVGEPQDLLAHVKAIVPSKNSQSMSLFDLKLPEQRPSLQKNAHVQGNNILRVRQWSAPAARGSVPSAMSPGAFRGTGDQDLFKKIFIGEKKSLQCSRLSHLGSISRDVSPLSKSKVKKKSKKRGTLRKVMSIKKIELDISGQYNGEVNLLENSKPSLFNQTDTGTMTGKDRPRTAGSRRDFKPRVSDRKRPSTAGTARKKSESSNSRTINFCEKFANLSRKKVIVNANIRPKSAPQKRQNLKFGNFVQKTNQAMKYKWPITKMQASIKVQPEIQEAYQISAKQIENQYKTLYAKKKVDDA